ncbi:MAG: nitroreductase family protein [Thermodesulfobacteriota bacterium]
MGAVMEAIKNRRSIRKYEEKDVPEAVVKELLEAVQWSQSWANTQCWEVIVVRGQQIKDQLSEAVLKGNPAQKAVSAAPVVLVLCAKLKSSGYYKDVVTTKFGDWFMFDIGIAAQNICLQAQDMGLGAVVMGLFDHNKIQEILGVPGGYEVVTMIPLGYPAKPASAPKRREIAEFTHYERF